MRNEKQIVKIGLEFRYPTFLKAVVEHQCSWEEAMMLAATALAHQKGVLEGELTKLLSRTSPPIILIDEKL